MAMLETGRSDGRPPLGRGGGGGHDVVADQMASWALRLGLAFVFGFAALSSFFEPETFAGYFPAFLPSSWATELLPVFAVYEVLLAVSLVAGRQTYRAALLSALTLAAITVANPDAFEVLFRNVAIACAALALAAQTRPERLRVDGEIAVAVAVESESPPLRAAEATSDA